MGQDVDETEEVEGLDLDHIDKDEKEAGNMAFCALSPFSTGPEDADTHARIY